jgi:hypothetical protein
MNEFLPQIQAVQCLYDAYIAQGKEPQDAVTLILEACLGIQQQSR